MNIQCQPSPTSYVYGDGESEESNGEISFIYRNCKMNGDKTLVTKPKRCYNLMLWM